MMFELALKAKIPIIGVHTDDPVNAPHVLQLIAKRSVGLMTGTKNVKLAPVLYYTFDPEVVTNSLYEQLAEGEYQLVLINAKDPNVLVFDAGVLPTPPSLVHEYLQAFTSKDQIDDLMIVLRGLSLKTASEIVQITMARTGGLALPEVRRTRAMVGGHVQGLYTVDTEPEFYDMPHELESWLKTNKPYFMHENVPHKLVPRGLLFDGAPGVGKSMAARAIAREFGVPLYRLDIATTLNKYIGESEARIARALSTVERESPCVLLIDEVEKVFAHTDEGGVTTRMLSQLLWWLAEHRSRVITIMTTNNKSALPEELYRSGRIDHVILLRKLKWHQALQFAYSVYEDLLGTIPSEHKVVLHDLFGGSPKLFAHSEVAELVYEKIKENQWFVPEKTS